jgi:hypothetical protein
MDPNDTGWCPCSKNRAVGDFRELGESITWTVNSPAAGSATLTWRYGAGNAAVARTLTVNGKALGSVNFPKTSGWANWRTVTFMVTLRAGANTVRIAVANANTNYLNVDYLDVTAPRA